MLPITRIEVNINLGSVDITRDGWLKNERRRHSFKSLRRLNKAIAKDVNHLDYSKRPLMTFTDGGWIAEW